MKFRAVLSSYRCKGMHKGQASLELALVVPVLLILVFGVVEVSLIIDRYMDMLDLTREAARFASQQDPFTPTPATLNCDPNNFDFFYSTACFFFPPTNSYMIFNDDTDDIVISAYTVRNHTVADHYPTGGFWSLNGNWDKDCEGNVTLSQPHFTDDVVNSLLLSSAPLKEGFVGVEFYHCYDLTLNIPVISSFIPNPLRLHAYTLMPLPKAE